EWRSGGECLERVAGPRAMQIDGAILVEIAKRDHIGLALDRESDVCHTAGTQDRLRLCRRRELGMSPNARAWTGLCAQHQWARLLRSARGGRLPPNSLACVIHTLSFL